MSSSNMVERMAEILKFAKCLAMQHFNDVNLTFSPYILCYGIFLSMS